ncbi:MAG: hypothetical protein E6P95_01650 [Candidatus Moraniibacteriota bacterium]|nr:MAG: hypothetical protein E6P95_01650 [Candidatus Moranbacteria bacterium]
MAKNEGVYRSRKRMLIDNLLGGIMWSIGVWIGTTLIAVILLTFLSKVDFVAVVADFITEVTKHMAKNRSFFPF